MSTRRTLSPRDLARAIGSSESSLKRWADEGRIRVHRTAGGHRRITVAEAVRFIRESGSPVVDPSALGVGDLGRFPRSSDAAEPRATPDLQQLLVDGDDSSARGALVSWYLEGRPLCDVFDGPLSTALHRIGELWEGDARGVFVEHRATEICVHALHQIRAMLPAVEDGPVAVGGAIEGDPYALPTLMASMVLQEEGWRAISLGPDSPAASIAHAVDQEGARLIWASVSSGEVGPEAFDRALDSLRGCAREHGIRLALGGRRRDLLATVHSDDVFVGSSMRELVAFVRGLRAGGSI